MERLSSNKFIRYLMILLILLLVIILALFGFFVSPFSPQHVCTLMGCRDSLELDLSHEPPQKYTLLVTGGSGDARSVTCTPGIDSAQSAATGPFAVTCQSGKVTFYDFAPSKVTVQITWQGSNYTTSGRPSYHTFRPNGPFCPPECRAGSFQVDIP
jgi:hypothetical protein